MCRGMFTGLCSLSFAANSWPRTFTVVAEHVVCLTVCQCAAMLSIQSVGGSLCRCVIVDVIAAWLRGPARAAAEFSRCVPRVRMCRVRAGVRVPIGQWPPSEWPAHPSARRHRGCLRMHGRYKPGERPPCPEVGGARQAP
jgi:hypothetical protein